MNKWYVGAILLMLMGIALQIERPEHHVSMGLVIVAAIYYVIGVFGEDNQ